MGRNQSERKDILDKNAAKPKDIHMLQSNPTQAGGKRSCDDTDDAPLVISLHVGDCTVKRILVDSRNATNMSFWDAVTHIGIWESDIRQHVIPLIGFTGRSVNSSGVVDLPVKINYTSWHMEFLVVDTPSSYI